MKYIFAVLLALGAAGARAEAALVSRPVAYEQAGAALEGYLVYDDQVKGARPGVLVFHEWWGLGPYAKRRADELAKLGYVAFAADMYGKGKYATDHEQAGKLAGAFQRDRAAMRARAQAALDVLLKQADVDAKRVGAIGYCFGGTAALELARTGAPLRAVATFHGGVDTPQPEQTAPFPAKLLTMIGADDKYLTPAIPKFEEEMRRVHADWQLVLYGGAVHSFTVREAGDDPSKGAAYNADADRRSWAAMQAFFSETLR